MFIGNIDSTSYPIMFQGLASSITGALSQIRQETQLNDTGIGQSTSHDSGLELQGRSGMDYVVINIMLCPDTAINTNMMLFVTSGDCGIITQCPYYFTSVTRSKVYKIILIARRLV